MLRRIISPRYFDKQNIDARLKVGLVGHFFGGGSGLIIPDQSGYMNHGTLVNGATWALGPFNSGHAIDLDGTNDYINVPSFYGFTNRTTTVAMWVKLRAYDTFGAVLLSSLNGALDDLFWEIQATGVEFNVQGAGAVTAPGSISWTDGTWRHIAMTADGGGNVAVYVNGVLVASGTGGKDVDSTPREYYIGEWIGSPATDFSTNGQLYDIRLYNRVLSSGEINLLADPTRIAVVNSARRQRSYSDGLQSLIGAFLASGAALYAPTITVGDVTLTGAHLSSGVVLYDPSLAYQLEPPTIASGAVTYEPVVTVGSVTLEPPTIASGAVVYGPSLIYIIDSPTIPAGTLVYTPTVLLDPLLELPFITSGATLFRPSVSDGTAATVLGTGKLFQGEIQQMGDTFIITSSMGSF
jgi:hypothetical protein